MLTKRIIACLDVADGRVVKGVQFEQLRDAGDPAELAAAHAEAGADEVVLLDVTATHENRATLIDTVRRAARQLFIPFTVGGGIRSLAEAKAVFDAGADKISINSAALADPRVITSIAERYGSQAVIVAIDAKRAGERRFEAYVNGGGSSTDDSFATQQTIAAPPPPLPPPPPSASSASSSSSGVDDMLSNWLYDLTSLAVKMS